ncbi:hypothetical protein V6N13_142264 [Hibiscus sabdariffa]|uniref:Uncharacterized protein n=1 Tax=Hibiscus sabdariffa TaxID=183260 RepID=A0ABR2FDM6_9ROSI
MHLEDGQDRGFDDSGSGAHSESAPNTGHVAGVVEDAGTTINGQLNDLNNVVHGGQSSVTMPGSLAARPDDLVNS